IVSYTMMKSSHKEPSQRPIVPPTVAHDDETPSVEERSKDCPNAVRKSKPLKKVSRISKKPKVMQTETEQISIKPVKAKEPTFRYECPECHLKFHFKHRFDVHVRKHAEEEGPHKVSPIFA